jgi:glycosyltransferase involved in cell wall biosynthesis
VTERFALDPGSVEVIPNGCAAERAPRPLTESELAGTAPYVLAVGSLDPRKNLAGLQQAMSIVRTAHPEVGLLITGAQPVGVFATSTHDWTSLDTVTGHVTDDELFELFRRAQCLAYPSFYEGFGLPPLEAMALGTRAVVSRLPSIEELCADVAVYVDPHDPRDIARGIEQVLNETSVERGEAIADGLERAQHYTWAMAARRYDNLFAELLGVAGPQDSTVQR